jgi:16S rRNA (guanine527-N7)-methyltransferase
MSQAASLRPALLAGLVTLNLPLADDVVDRLLAYLDLVARWNKVYNLTAVRELSDMLGQHLLDCLAVVKPLREALAPAQASAQAGGPPVRVLDVGSGAGLPGVVLALCNPDWQITCVDTVAKKASFIRQAGLELGLPNLNALHQRVEDIGEPVFQLITSRAFASLADFTALTRECLAPQGQWAAMKAKLGAEERGDLPADVNLLAVQPLAVPSLDAERCIVWMKLHAAA